MSTVTPIVILPFNYSEGLAFEGKNAAEFTKLLASARIVVQQSRNSRYGWYLADPDSDISPNIQIRTRPFDEEEASTLLREELDRARTKLSKHADMIDAAESLNP